MAMNVGYLTPMLCFVLAAHPEHISELFIVSTQIAAISCPPDPGSDLCGLTWFCLNLDVVRGESTKNWLEKILRTNNTCSNTFAILPYMHYNDWDYDALHREQVDSMYVCVCAVNANYWHQQNIWCLVCTDSRYLASPTTKLFFIAFFAVVVLGLWFDGLDLYFITSTLGAMWLVWLNQRGTASLQLPGFMRDCFLFGLQNTRIFKGHRHFAFT